MFGHRRPKSLAWQNVDMKDDFFLRSTLINTFFSSVFVLMVINHNKLLFQSQCFISLMSCCMGCDVVNYHLSSNVLWMQFDRPYVKISSSVELPAIHLTFTIAPSCERVRCKINLIEFHIQHAIKPGAEKIQFLYYHFCGLLKWCEQKASGEQ